MTLNFWKARRAKAIEQLRDDILAAARSGLKICMYVRDEELSEDDRQATYEAAQLFAAIELDLEHAETQDEVISAAGQVLDLLNNEWFKHLIASNEP